VKRAKAKPELLSDGHTDADFGPVAPVELIEVAVPAPLPLLTYGVHGALPARGTRVVVPLGSRKLVGIVWGRTILMPAKGKLRIIEARLEEKAKFSDALLDLAAFGHQYYHHPLGEVLHSMLPKRLRSTEVMPDARTCVVYTQTERGRQVELDTLKSGHKRNIMSLLRAKDPLTRIELKLALPSCEAALKVLLDQGWIERLSIPEFELPARAPVLPPLSAEQEQVTSKLAALLGEFRVALLEGVTGSGKTEVYLNLVARVMAAGGQALLLMPEIGLTPQFMARLRERLPARVALLHSELSDLERAQAWLAAEAGHIDVVIGTRSALFTPLRSLRLIVLDEEHDASFKQGEGWRYSARDLAIKLGQLQNCPVILGSATPSLETLKQCRDGRYLRFALKRRFGAAVSPTLEFIDLRKRALYEGLSETALAAIAQALERGEQALVFKNQRGFAASMLCHDCGWHAACDACARPLTWHRSLRRMICHHCGEQQSTPRACPQCGSLALVGRGVGTERLEEFLGRRFPSVPLIRLDRDSTARKGSLEASLMRIREAESAIIVGTQMLAKGHDWPRVTLVVIVDVDGALFSSDFRAGERLAQLVVQVSGRAGRAERPGKVLLQTHDPEHPLLQAILRGGYHLALEHELGERAQAELPPFSALALLSADADDAGAAQAFLIESQQLLAHSNAIQWHGPIPAPIEKRAHRYRFQVWIQAPSRAGLRQFLESFMSKRLSLPARAGVRWNLDVDPIELG
jgi:primosomal protein N' (replication factor Y)